MQRQTVLTRNVLENEKGPPVIELSQNFTPKCEIKVKETLSAISRARTQQCKQEISNVACLDKEGKLYPKTLPRFCPYKGMSNFSSYFIAAFDLL